MNTFQTRAGLSLAATLVLATGAQAVVTISNLPGNDLTQSAALTNLRVKAMAFTTDNDDWFFVSAVLRLRTNPNVQPLLTLNADNNGTVGSVLTTLTSPGSLGTGIDNYTFQGGSYVVNANTKYWLVLSQPGTTSGLDWMASSPAQTPTGLWTHSGSLFSTNGGSTFANSSILNSYEINARVVPEPASMLALSAGLLALARRRRSRA